jgi:hypothetical protein
MKNPIEAGLKNLEVQYSFSTEKRVSVYSDDAIWMLR